MVGSGPQKHDSHSFSDVGKSLLIVQKAPFYAAYENNF